MTSSPSPQELGLLSRNDVHGLPDGHPLRKTLEWIEEVVAKPNPNLGRSGVVCPFIPGSLQAKTIWFALPDAHFYIPQDVMGVLNHYRDVFEQISPVIRPDAYFKTIIIAFPSIGPDRATRFIDDVQSELKSDFISRGLMLGEFHPENVAEGLHSRDFRPLQSPVPLLVIRRMVPPDRFFLIGKNVPASKKLLWLKAYVDELQHMPGQEHKPWARDLKELRDELFGEDDGTENGQEDGEAENRQNEDEV
ncbi:DUF6875 domain-containing protein [Streptomyces sp. NPDC054945]